MNRILDLATSFGATVSRLGAGVEAGEFGARPEKPLELYEFEACPYCRKVRDALTSLDLEALIHPCPKTRKTTKSTSWIRLAAAFCGRSRPRPRATDRS